MRIIDWSSDVCSSDLLPGAASDPSPSPRERSEAVIYSALLMEPLDVCTCQRSIHHALSTSGRMSLAVTLSRAQEGIAAPQVMVEVHISGGFPCTNIVDRKSVGEEKRVTVVVEYG